jgi:hypothetical protein
VPQSSGPAECPSPGRSAPRTRASIRRRGPCRPRRLRAMLEPLHWRGDRATMNDFNKAFVGLMGTADIGPINGAPAGVSARTWRGSGSSRWGSVSVPILPQRGRHAPEHGGAGPGNTFAGNPTRG